MKRFAWLSLLVVASALSPLAGSANAHTTGASAQAANDVAGTVGVNFTVHHFIRQGKHFIAHGEAVATYTPTSGEPTTVRQSFTAQVVVGPGGRALSAVAVTCPVLFLNIDKLALNLLGLHADLDKLTLTITANSKGGALGSLFCALAHTKVKLTPGKLARRLTAIAQQSGLASSGLTFTVPLQAAQQTVPAGFCEVLDLVLGPLDLNLLGLLVHLNQVHLALTADPVGGVLGSLFCALAHTKLP
jgi:hypothetical protein